MLNAAVTTTTRKLLPSILLPSAGLIFSSDQRSDNVSLCEQIQKNGTGSSYTSIGPDDGKKREAAYHEALEKKKGVKLSKRVS